MTAVPPKVALAGDRFDLSGPPPALGSAVAAPGAGARALYAAPCLEAHPTAAAAAFARAAAARRPGLGLIALSADDAEVRARWCRDAGWRPGACDLDTAARLGIWLPRLGLFPCALLVVDGRGRLRHAEVAARLDGAPDFAAALAVIGRLA